MSPIKEEYYPLLPSPGLFESALENWKATVTSQALTLVDEPTQALDLAEHLFPNMATIFHILLTMPVTTASSERSFSVLKRLKTYLRNTMGIERLNGLALLHIHREEPVDVDQVVKEFDATGHRRIATIFI